uniref:Uncharacterized protein n=1 Tax=Panagrolaimus davidi TaxID=227884 RepID=A0A914PLD0_9BILA
MAAVTVNLEINLLKLAPFKAMSDVRTFVMFLQQFFKACILDKIQPGEAKHRIIQKLGGFGQKVFSRYIQHRVTNPTLMETCMFLGNIFDASDLNGIKKIVFTFLDECLPRLMTVKTGLFKLFKKKFLPRRQRIVMNMIYTQDELEYIQSKSSSSDSSSSSEISSDSTKILSDSTKAAVVKKHYYAEIKKINEFCQLFKNALKKVVKSSSEVFTWSPNFPETLNCDDAEEEDCRLRLQIWAAANESESRRVTKFSHQFLELTDEKKWTPELLPVELTCIHLFTRTIFSMADFLDMDMDGIEVIVYYLLEAIPSLNRFRDLTLMIEYDATLKARIDTLWEVAKIFRNIE